MMAKRDISNICSLAFCMLMTEYRTVSMSVEEKMGDMTDKICVAMSGGVDSSVCALLLARSGADVTGATMTLGTPDDADNVRDARAVCEALGIPHLVFDMEEDFTSCVIQPFVDEHRACRTPNPCVTCNAQIKFGLFREKAHEKGFHRIATGHYLRRRERNGRAELLRARDMKKDQSYFLCQVPERALRGALFPLGEMEKQEAISIARAANLPTAERSESQDICFIKDTCTEFLKERLGILPGSILDADGREVGTHEGAHLYTIGQRKGLRLALGHPAYACAKDAAANTVTVGSIDEVHITAVHVRALNQIAPFPAGTFSCAAKLRYNMQPAPCTVEMTPEGATLRFASPVFAPAPGQAAALYDGDLLLGGGEIF